MDSYKIIDREDRLSSWRSAILLTFNGLLLNTVSSENLATQSKLLQASIMLVGGVLSISFLGASIISCLTKYRAEFNLKITQKTKASYLMIHCIGPHLLSGILLFLFWVLYFIHTLLGRLSSH